MVHLQIEKYHYNDHVAIDVAIEVFKILIEKTLSTLIKTLLTALDIN